MRPPLHCGPTRSGCQGTPVTGGPGRSPGSPPAHDTSAAAGPRGCLEPPSRPAAGAPHGHVRTRCDRPPARRRPDRTSTRGGGLGRTRRLRAGHVRRRRSRPRLAAYGLAMYVGQVFALNADDHTTAAPNDGPVQPLHLPELGIGLLAAAIAVLAASQALSRPPATAERWALGLATLAAASIPIFWAGWP